MLERLTALFRHHEEPLPPLDENLALGVLLVRVAQADHVYRFEEIARIDEILAAGLDLNPVEAARMRATCEKLSKALADEDALAALIRDSVPEAKRIAAAQALRDVAMADGRTDDAQADIIEHVTDRLGVSGVDPDRAPRP